MAVMFVSCGTSWIRISTARGAMDGGRDGFGFLLSGYVVKIEWGYP